MRRLHLLLLLVCVMCASGAYADSSVGKGNVTITGTVVQQGTGQPLEFVTVVVVEKQSDVPIEATTTAADGSFVLHTHSRNFYVKISFIGFKTKSVYSVAIEHDRVPLGVVTLEQDAKMLNEVSVRAEKSTTEFKLDKRVFNVGKDLSSTGASALEVLNNVPSVRVSIEGEISLRGSSGVQMLINGKPSVLANEEGNALGTITADMIEKVEVITNPSAKYSAEGTSGIINIVLKKNEHKGLNGAVTLNTGYPNNHSVGFSLSRRTQKFNLFSQLGLGYRTFPAEASSISRDYKSHTEVNSSAEGDKNETFYNVILGTDYLINKYNVITLSGHFAYEKETENSEGDYQRLVYEAMQDKWRRKETTKATNPKYQYELQYKKTFRENKEHTLLASATGDFFGKDKHSDFVNSVQKGAATAQHQQSRTNFKEAEFVYKVDYSNPFTKHFTLEAGSQYQINDVSNDYAVSNLQANLWVLDQNLTNVFDYTQKVLGVYGIMSYEGQRWGAKAGLRMEHSDVATELQNTQLTNTSTYADWFPSVHTSYKISQDLSVQLAYSRRIFRPRLWDLNPFFNIRNNYNVFTGNPGLKPEYSDAYELSSIYNIHKLSINFSVYHRFTTDVMEEAVSFENNVSVIKPYNIGTRASTGVELNGKYQLSKGVSVLADFNYGYFNRKGSFKTQTFDFSASQWHTRATTKIKLPLKFDVELTGNYDSKSKTFQQNEAASWSMDFGARKKILKGRAVINLSVRDVFASRKHEASSMQTDYYTYSTHQRGRYIILGVSYGFGKGEAMEFAGAKQF